MDSVSHTRVANLLLSHIEATTRVTFDQNAFRYGNLKPDLTGTYLTKRHYPSIMFEEVKDKIRLFCKKYTIHAVNGRELSIDLGEICHYLTDFFCYPHNDDIYPHGLLAHYIYEKRTALCLHRSLTQAHFEGWVEGLHAPFTVEGLIARIEALHKKYHDLPEHGIPSDIEYICRVTTLCVRGIIHITYESSAQESVHITA